MNVKETFLELTSRTYPHGTESELFDKLPADLNSDEFGNLFIQIGESDVMFTSHLDTATQANTQVNHVFEDSIIKTDGKSILGADDKAGVTVMLYMIEKKVPGLYYFFLGEEVGCVGSKKVSEKHKTEKLPHINKVVSFDRRGLGSIITFQGGSRCCSDKFGTELANQLNLAESTFSYKNDPTGVYTDSAQFVKIYPECTNISVGYYSEHTYSERQDIDHLTKLAEAACKVNWTSLPVERDPSKTEYSSYGHYGWGGWDDEYYGGYGSYGASYRNTGSSSSSYSYKPKATTEKIYFHDKENNYVSCLDVDKSSGKITAVNLHENRIHHEEEEIYNFLYQVEIEYETMNWNGLVLTLTYPNGKENSTISREELGEYIDALDLSKQLANELEEKEYYFID